MQAGNGSARVVPAMDLAALKAVTRNTIQRAASLEVQGQIGEAQALCVALFDRLHTFFPPAGELAPGWPRVVAALTDLSHRLSVDALARGILAQLYVRAATLLDLPDITDLTSLSESSQIIRSAVELGTERYNRGDVRGCCIIYWASGQVLLAAVGSRGISGSARVLAPIRQTQESEPPARPFDRSEMHFFCWALRLGFDTALKAIQESGAPLHRPG